MAQPSFEIRYAAVTALRADSEVQTAMTGAVTPIWNIFDNVPVNTVFPYQYIGDLPSSVGTALTLNKGKATDVMLTIHIFSQYLGWREVESIVSADDDVLNEKPLTLTNGFNNFFLLFDRFIPVRVEPDGITRHGVVRYKLMCQG